MGFYDDRIDSGIECDDLVKRFLMHVLKLEY